MAEIATLIVNIAEFDQRISTELLSLERAG